MVVVGSLIVNGKDISSVSATLNLPLLHLHLKIGRKETGKKEHDWSDDGSDPMRISRLFLRL